jgi:hypothetical protein
LLFVSAASCESSASCEAWTGKPLFLLSLCNVQYNVNPVMIDDLRAHVPSLRACYDLKLDEGCGSCKHDESTPSLSMVNDVMISPLGITHDDDPYFFFPGTSSDRIPTISASHTLPLATQSGCTIDPKTQTSSLRKTPYFRKLLDFLQYFQRSVLGLL